MDEITLFAELRPDDKVPDRELAALRDELFTDLMSSDLGADEPGPRLLGSPPVEAETTQRPERRRSSQVVAVAAAPHGVVDFEVILGVSRQG